MYRMETSPLHSAYTVRTRLLIKKDAMNEVTHTTCVWGMPVGNENGINRLQVLSHAFVDDAQEVVSKLRTLRTKVSSRHLIPRSRVFRYQKTIRRLLIVMNIVYGHSRKEPKRWTFLCLLG